MSLWYRVFGGNNVEPAPGAILAHLNGLGAVVTGRFRGDADGWFEADLLVADTTALHLERFLAAEEGIRAELNSYVAWLETREGSPQQGALIARVVQTVQLFTLERPDGPGDGELLDRLGGGLCRFLAGVTAGVYQVDGEGFFAADGALLLGE
jgi:hypothetical protein